MITNSVRLRLLVDDYDRAINFYVNQLSLFAVESDRNSGQERSVSLCLVNKCPNFVLDLSDVSSDTSLCDLVGRQCGDSILMTIPINSVEQMESTLRSAGLNLDGRNELPYGEWLFIRDPFGNRIALCEEFD